MKNIFLSLSLLIAITSSSQTSSRCDTSESAVFRKNNVLAQKEFNVDKKTKKKTLSALREYDVYGCVSKLVVPYPNENEIYHFNEWEYDSKGNLLNYREGKIDKDSSQSIAFSENYSYTSAGLLSRYRKEVYENEFSTISTKWEYEYSDKGDKKEITYSLLRVRKDSICSEEVKYTGNEIPLERTVHNYYPKGVSDLTKFSSSGLPIDYMRYEKGKAISHKIYSYLFDKQGVLSEEIIADGITKTTEKMKYEKDKITFTKLNTKGKVLSTSSQIYSAPKVFSYPPIASATAPAAEKKEPPKNISKKEKTDKKKNKITENYISGKLVSTEMYNPKGLLIESNPAEGEFLLQYEYVSY